MTEFKEVIDFRNLYTAFRDSRKGKRDKKSVARYEVNILENLIILQHNLSNMKYSLSPYNVFYVFEPKKRRIMSNSFEDKIVQHAMCDNVVAPILNPKLIYDNAANQKGKGVHFALNRLSKQLRKHYINYGTKGYILKCDIHKYFDSMAHKHIKKNTIPHLKDYGSKWLWSLFIDSVPDPMAPMGNLSSQSHAITYLDPLDQMIKRELKIKGYVRYVDDFVLIHEDKKYLQYCKRRIEDKLDELELKLNPKSDLFPLKNGVDFLGFHTYITDTGKVIRKIRRKSKTKVRRKMRYMKEKLNNNQIDIESIIQSYSSWRGHAKHGNCYYLIRKMDRYFMQLYGKELEGINSEIIEEIKENINYKEDIK